MKATFSSKGFGDFLERIDQLGKDVNEIAAKALLAGAEELQAEMLSRVPVDTGNLRDHIRIVGPKIRGNWVSVDVGVIADKQYTDADTMRYAVATEYGWRGGSIRGNKKRKIKAKTGGAKGHAQPFIRPAIDYGKRKARRTIIDVLKQESEA